MLWGREGMCWGHEEMFRDFPPRINVPKFTGSRMNFTCPCTENLVPLRASPGCV